MFQFLCHNYRGVSPGGGPPINPDDGTQCLLENGNYFMPVNVLADEVRGAACSSRDGQKILLSTASFGQGRMYFSNDGFQSFITRDFIESNFSGHAFVDFSTSVCVNLRYNDDTDRFFMSVLDNLDRSSTRFFYSDDDGATWTNFEIGDVGGSLSPIRGYAFGFAVNPSGTEIMAMGRAESLGSSADRDRSIGRSTISGTTPPVFNGVDFTKLGEGGNVSYDARNVGGKWFIREVFQPGAAGNRLCVWGGTGALESETGGYDTYSVRLSGGNNYSEVLAFEPVGLGIKRIITGSDPLNPDAGRVFLPAPAGLTTPFIADIYWGSDGASQYCAVVLDQALSTHTVMYLYTSTNGQVWNGPYPLNFLEPCQSEEVWLFYRGNSKWGLLYKQDNNNPTAPAVMCFEIGEAGAINSPKWNDLTRAVAAQLPEIWIEFDEPDDPPPETVIDIGSLQLPNSVTEPVVFGQPPIYLSEGGAMLVNGGDVTVEGASNYEHVTVVIANMVTGVSFDTPAFRLGAGGGNFTIDDVDTGIPLAPYVIVQTFLDKVTVLKPTDGSVGYEVARDFSGAEPGNIIIGEENGTVVDEYIQISNDNANVAAIYNVLGPALLGGAFVPQDPENGGPSVTTREVIALFNMDEGPASSPPNEGRDAVGSLIQPITRVTEGAAKFGSRFLNIPYRSASRNYQPITQPYWNGLSGLGVGDFTIEGWVKPGWSNGFCYLASNQSYARIGGIWRRWGGFTISLSGALNKGKVSFYIGDSYQAAAQGGGLDFRSGNACLVDTSLHRSWSPNAYNHVRICRKDGVMYIFLNGTLPGQEAYSSVAPGDARANFAAQPIIDAGTPMYFGGYLIQYSNYRNLALYSPPVSIDAFRFIRGEAVSINEFTPPAGPFTE